MVGGVQFDEHRRFELLSYAFVVDPHGGQTQRVVARRAPSTVATI